MPFNWRYNLSAGRPLVLTYYMKDTETLTKGDIINIETGEADLGVTTDVAFAGQMLGAATPTEEKDSNGVLTPGVVSGTDSTTIIKAIANPDAVYGVNDANARQPGALLDISGATGAQTVGASSNTEFVVVERKNQTSDETRVQIISTNHYLAKAQ